MKAVKQMDKQKYRCNSCNYRFFRIEKPEQCPYCGKKSVIEDKQTSAEELLKNID